MSQADEAFLAGSRSFTLALFGPLTESTGSRPRLVADPAQAMVACAGAAGLLVIEASPEWLPAVEHLRRQAPALRILAAVGPGHEALSASLQALGAAPVAWQGQSGPILAAARAVGRPPIGGADPFAARQAEPAVELFTPAPAAAQAVVATRGPVVSGPPVLSPPSPPVLSAAPPPVPVQARTVAAPAAAHAPGSTSAPADAMGASPAVARAAPPPYQPSPAAPAAPAPAPQAPAAPAWPSQVPDEEAAESALVRALRGTLPAESPLAAVAARAVAALSPLERKALAGEPIPFDVAPIYRAAVLRLRTTVALESVPAPPALVDHDAVEALLGALDEVLVQVNPLVARAAEPHLAELEAVRHALVRVAVDFSEAAHRLGPVAAAASGDEAAPVRTRAQRETKLLSVHSGAEDDSDEPRRTSGWLVALAVVAVLVGGYHAWRWIDRPAPIPPPTLPGAPANTLAFRNEGGQFLMAFGAPIDAAELQRFVEQEKLKGNTVREIATGTWIIEPKSAEKDGKTP